MNYVLKLVLEDLIFNLKYYEKLIGKISTDLTQYSSDKQLPELNGAIDKLTDACAEIASIIIKVKLELDNDKESRSVTLSPTNDLLKDAPRDYPGGPVKITSSTDTVGVTEDLARQNGWIP